jgi:hypothetical protein
LISIVGLVGAGFAAWQTQPTVREPICGWQIVAERNLASCVQFRRISAQEASDFLNVFVGKSSVRERDTYQLLRDKAKDDWPLDRWVSQWEGVLWAEGRTIEPVEGTNSFRFRYRVFEGRTNEDRSGDVQERSFDVVLAPAERGSELTVSGLSDVDKVGKPATLTRPAARLLAGARPHEAPRSDSEEVQGNFPTGGMVRLLCKVNQTDGFTWYRTPLGFLRSNGFTVAQRSTLDVVIECDEHFVATQTMPNEGA